MWRDRGGPEVPGLDRGSGLEHGYWCRYRYRAIMEDLGFLVSLAVPPGKWDIARIAVKTWNSPVVAVEVRSPVRLLNHR